jgi:branched-chain amino acid aminotransferase
MSGWIDYWNGRFVPDDEVRISPSDRGFVLGDAVYEVTRTYRHVPFHLDWHLDRLFAGLRYIELDPLLTRSEIKSLTLEVLERNRARLRSDDDVTLTQRITRGPNVPLYGGPPPGPPTVIIACRPINFSLFARIYGEGVDLTVPSVRLAAKGGIDPRIKIQSRLPMALAFVQVTRGGGHVLPLMVDVEGYISETSHTNLFVVIDTDLVTPPDEVALEGITRRVVMDLARKVGLNVTRRPLHVSEMNRVTEAFVTSTWPGPVPVRIIDGRALRPIPGPITSLLTKAFSEYVGVDIVNQGRAHVPSRDGHVR